MDSGAVVLLSRRAASTASPVLAGLFIMMLPRTFRRPLLFSLALFALAFPALADFPPEGRLTVSNYKVKQGEVVVVGIRAPRGVERLEGQFLDRGLCFFPTEEGEYEALAGIDLEDKPGFHEVRVFLMSGDGQTSVLRKAVEVKAGDFPIDKLTVEDSMVEFDDETADRIRDENQRMEMALAVRTGRQFGERFVLPVNGGVSSSFGRRRMYNGKMKAPHSGTDLKAPVSTAIRAAAAGTVVISDAYYLPGNVVLIDHGKGVFTAYYHLKESRVQPDQAVAAGEIIGFVGMTGRVTGPHLHWMGRVAGARIDPMALRRLKLSPAAEGVPEPEPRTSGEPEPPEPEEADRESQS